MCLGEIRYQDERSRPYSVVAVSGVLQVQSLGARRVFSEQHQEQRRRQYGMLVNKIQYQGF